MIIIADIGVGNTRSVKYMLDYLDIESEILNSSNNVSYRDSRHIILPGVGSFDSGVQCLDRSGWGSFLQNNQSDFNILGICLGMELLMGKSEEGLENGLGMIAGMCVKFDQDKVRVPNIGWRNVEITRKNNLLSEDKEYKFYFSHSYYIEPVDDSVIVGKTDYEISFPSIIQKGNIYGCQFHPERSHKFGMELLKNFAKS